MFITYNPSIGVLISQFLSEHNLSESDYNLITSDISPSIVKITFSKTYDESAFTELFHNIIVG